MSLTRKIAKNTIYNVTGRFWGVGVGLLLTPYIIRHIGVERYGIFAIIGVISSYFGLLDFGIGASFVKYIAEFSAKGQYHKINQLINTGVVFYSLLAVVITCVVIFFVRSLLGFLKIPEYLCNETLFVFLVSVFIFSASNAVSPFNAVQSGLQRMDVSNKLAIAISIPYIIGVIFFLERGYGLRGLVINNAFIFLISAILNIIAAFRILPQLRFNPFTFSKEVFRMLFSFGYKIQIARISSMISMHMDKLIINNFFSVSFVAFYQLGSSIIESMKSIALLLPSAMMPAFSEIDAREEKKRLVDVYLRSSRYLALMVIPFFSFAVVGAPQIITMWMGQGYEKSAAIIQVLSIGWGFAVLSSMRSAMAQAIAKPEIEMEAGLVAVTLNIPLSIVCIIKFGFLGAAMGTSIALFFSALYGFLRLHKALKVNFWFFAKETILGALIICVGAGITVGIVTRVSSGIFPNNSRMTASVIFIAQALLFFGIYLKALSGIKPLRSNDVEVLLKNKPILLRRVVGRFSQ